MELTNEIDVNASVDAVWNAFTDVERIAPCLPGAKLTEIEGDEHRGVVKIKVGPINAQYKGQATFIEQDRDALKVVIKAEGRETRGQGNASATISIMLESLSETQTKVGVTTDLKITGKVAQIGRNLIPDVSAKLMDQFADNLETMLSAPAPAPAGDDSTASTDDAPDDNASQAATNGSSSGIRAVSGPEPEAVDLLDVAGAPVVKRVGPIAAVIVAFWFLRKILKRRKR